MDGIYFLPLLLHEWQRRRVRNGLRVERRRIRDAHNPFELEERHFKRLFRVSREIAQEVIVGISPRLLRRRSSGLPVHIQVLTAIRFFATGSYQRCVGQDFHISMGQASVSNCIRKVSQAINEILAPASFTFPRTFEERQVIKNRFMEARGFPGVIGCIDCTHVRVIKPSVREEAYYNHHYRSHSINVQAICDHDLRILSLSARFPGSVHDQFIWNNSRTREIMQVMYDEGIRNTWLLGDSGYALQPYLLTPIRQAVPNSPEERYTNCHCQTRNCVERLFGVIKNMWRCLHHERVLHYTPEVAAGIIVSCGVLHNMVISHRQELPAYEGQELQFVEQRLHNINEDEFAGENIRRIVIQQFFTF